MEMVNIMKFINENNGWISFWIGVFGLILSIISICVGVKAYKVAKEIYRNGVKLNTDKMLAQTGLELVIGFINPLYDFQHKTDFMYERAFYDQTVFEVKNRLKKYSFRVQFPYFDLHKGDICNYLKKTCG